jgi:hypothetical protein
MNVESAAAPPGAATIRWQNVTYAFAVVLASGLCYFLVRMPLQVSDSVALMMISQSQSAGEILANELQSTWNVRPLLQLSVNFAFEIARWSGRYFLTFKAIQIAQVLTVLILFARLLQVQSKTDFAAGSVAIVAVFGMHTFYSTVSELYPINTYLTILVCCIVALALIDGSPGLWRDVAAGGVFLFALLTLETGLLVWIIIATGFAVGFRGVSARAVAALTAGVLIYVGLKFFILESGIPNLDQVSTSFGFRFYNQQEVLDAFSDRRLVFYTANVISSITTLFLAEPRAGLWQFTRAVVTDHPVSLSMLLNVVTSTASSIVLFWYIWTRRRAWRCVEFERYDRFVIVFLAVAVVNAAISFPYTKDAIVSPAGMLLPLAMFSAVRAALHYLRDVTQRSAVVLASCALCLLSAGWAVRAAALPFGLFRTAYYYQQQWVDIDQWIVHQRLTHYTAEQRATIHELRDAALGMDVPALPLASGWMKWTEQIFDHP